MTSLPLFFFFFFLFRGFGKNYLVSRNGRKGDVRGEILFNDYGVVSWRNSWGRDFEENEFTFFFRKIRRSRVVKIRLGIRFIYSL